MKKLFKITIFSLSGLICFFSAFLLLGRIYEKQILTFVITELNKNLSTKIEPGQISFSFLKQFPKATIHFEDINIYSTNDFKSGTILINRDTLLHAKDLYIHLNIKKLIKKHFEIDGIVLQDGFIHILTNKNGKINYDFYKKNKHNTSSDFNIDLKIIKLKKIDIYYLDGTVPTMLKIFVPEIKLKGNFSAKSFQMASSGKLELKNVFINEEILKFDLPAKLNFSVFVNNNHFDIQKGNFEVEGNKIYLTGKIENAKKVKLNFEFHSNNLRIEQILKYFNIKLWNGFKLKGFLKFSAKIDGFIGDGQLPAIKANFECNNTILNSEKYGNFEIPFCRGQYNLKGKHLMASSKIFVDTLFCQLGNSKFNTKFQISNFQIPQILMEGNLNVDFSDFQHLLSNRDSLTGNLACSFSFNGNFNNFSSINLNTVINKKYNLTGSLDKTKWISPKFPSVNIPSLKFTCSENQIKIKQAAFKMQTNEINVSYAETDLKSLLNEKEPIYLNAKIETGKFNYDWFYSLFPDEESYDSSRQIVANVDFSAKQFIFDSILYSNFSGKIFYSDDRIEIQSLKTDICKGKANGWLRFIPKDSEKTDMAIELKIKDLDVQQMFETFNNFSQNVLLSDNVKGNCDASINLSCCLDKNYNPDFSSIVSEIEVLLKNGELINFKYLDKLSLFIDVKEVRHIRFSEWYNTIYIHDNTIFLPESDIKSNALNIKLSGQHNFNNQFKYNISVLLADLLWKKSKWFKNNDQEFGIVEEPDKNKTTLHLILEGNENDFKFLFDRAKAKEGVKTRVKEEKQTIKQILKEEFNLFKKDTSLNKKVISNDVPKYKIEWEELDTMP